MNSITKATLISTAGIFFLTGCFEKKPPPFVKACPNASVFTKVNFSDHSEESTRIHDYYDRSLSVHKPNPSLIYPKSKKVSLKDAINLVGTTYNENFVRLRDNTDTYYCTYKSKKPTVLDYQPGFPPSNNKAYAVVFICANPNTTCE